MITKVLSCKANPIAEGEQVVADQISAAHRYYNRLIELHREFRVTADELKRQHIPGLIEVESSVESLDAELRELRSCVRLKNAAARRKVATKEDTAQINDLKARLKLAREQRKKLRAEASTNAGYQSALAGLVVEYHGTLTPGSERRSGGLFKTARAECGVYPGTYLRVEAAVEAAVKSPGVPKFRHWTGDGLVGPQLTPPLSVADLLGCKDSRLRLEMLPSPSSKRRSDRALIWVRVASDGREPVWAKVPIHISKGQLPHDALITWATIVRRQVGMHRHKHPDIPSGVWKPHYEYSVQLTIRTNDTKMRATTGECGINLGWRVMNDDSLRVAYWIGSDDDSGDVRLPPRYVSAFRKADDIQSIRDQHFDVFRQSLVDWLTTVELPVEFAERSQHLWQWKGKRRLSGLIGYWSENRMVGDEIVFQQAIEWRVKETHLEQYELMLRKKAQRRRLDCYRKLVRQLSRKYSTILVDDTDYRKLARLPDEECNESVNETARYHARVASVGMLRSLLVQSGGIESDAKNITRQCYSCGQVSERPDDLEHICPHCAMRIDQDENAARVLLARAQVMKEIPDTTRELQLVDSVEVVSECVVGGGRWARRKANRSQKDTQECA